ncbi:MAG TPA: DMT family transporter [Dehalococcoidia bacterium]|nr:DMT family transporter [Dehalococcoidia bacterium]
MRVADYARLIALAALWGASFIFTRSASPEFGAIPTAWVRVQLGGLVLIGYFAAIGFDVGWRRDWRRFALIGVLNSSIPFSLYAFAALNLPASYSAIFNSTTSLFGATFAAVWLADPLTPRKLAGLVMGICGVALVAGLGGAETDANFFLAMAACLCAAVSYATVGVYVRKYARDLEPRAIAGASQMVAGVILLPLLVLDQPKTLDVDIAANLLGLALLSSGVAYLLYYRLLADVGPSKALTVTFLIPAFAMLWGAVFLEETITLTMLLGTAVIIGGTLLVTSRDRTVTEIALPEPAGMKGER